MLKTCQNAENAFSGDLSEFLALFRLEKYHTCNSTCTTGSLRTPSVGFRCYTKINLKKNKKKSSVRKLYCVQRRSERSVLAVAGFWNYIFDGLVLSWFVCEHTPYSEFLNSVKKQDVVWKLQVCCSAWNSSNQDTICSPLFLISR